MARPCVWQHGAFMILDVPDVTGYSTALRRTENVEHIMSETPVFTRLVWTNQTRYVMGTAYRVGAERMPLHLQQVHSVVQLQTQLAVEHKFSGF